MENNKKICKEHNQEIRWTCSTCNKELCKNICLYHLLIIMVAASFCKCIKIHFETSDGKLYLFERYKIVLMLEIIIKVHVVLCVPKDIFF